MDLLDGRDRGSPVADGSPKDAKPVLDQGKPPKDLYAVDAKITPVDSSVDSAPLGQWFSVDKAVCPTFCFSRGLSNVASPEGAKCASGEIRPLSALKAGLSFPYGCFGDCALASGSAGAKSTLGWCYMPGQSMDADPSDYTIGCFCK